MRVCFFIPSLGDGGAQRQCIALLNVLQHEPSVDVHLILLGRGQHEDSLDFSKLRVHRMDVGNFANPVALIFLVRTLLAVRPDILFSWLHPADILAYAATRLFRNVCWAMAERDSAYPDDLVYNLRKRIGRKADIIIANSDQGKRMWELLAASSRIVKIPNIALNGPVESRTCAALDVRTSCLSVGRLEPQKNVRGMTEAFIDFAAGEPYVELVVAGVGSERLEMNQLIESASLGHRVRFLGFRNDVFALMSQARILLSFSLHEGMPNVLMEAAIIGLPAVVSDIPEHRSLLGSDYPFYVAQNATAVDAGVVIRRAWHQSAEDISDIYEHARSVISLMTPKLVGEAYLEALTTTVATKSVFDRGRYREM